MSNPPEPFEWFERPAPPRWMQRLSTASSEAHVAWLACPLPIRFATWLVIAHVLLPHAPSLWRLIPMS